MIADDRTLPSLHDCASRLGALPAACEAEFLRIGTELTAAVGAVGRVQASLGDLRDRLTGSDMRNAREVLGAGAARIAALLGGAAAGRTSLADLQDLIAQAQQRLTALGRVIGEIGVIAVNAQIQAAQLTQSGIDFTVFTRDIARLQRLAGQAVERCRASLGRLVEVIDVARRNLTQFDQEHAASLDEVKTRLSEGVARLHTRDQRTARLIDVINAQSREISAGIGGAIAGLQINDITMQRADHVREALVVLAGAAAAAEPLVVAAACRLQALQLNRAGEDFAGAVERVIGDLKRLSQATDKLTAEAAGDLAGDGRGDSLIQAVEQSCDRVAAFLQAFRRTEEKMREAIGTVSSGVVGMAADIGAIHNIEADMRIMGLNATLKCGRLGADGRALAVIAQELRAYSRQIGEDSQAIITLISQATAIGAALSGTGQSDGEAAASGLEADMRRAQAILSTLSADVSAGMAAARRDGAAASAALAHTADGVTLHRVVPERLNGVATAIGALADRLDPERRGDGGLDAEIERLLGRNYTMAGERAIRTQFAGTAAGTAPGKTPPPAATANIEEFFL